MLARRIELICGVLAGALGLAALAVGLFAPLYAECTSTTDGQSGCSMVSLAQVQGLASITLAIEVFGLLPLGIALFAIVHSASRNIVSLALLWACTLLLCINTVLAAPSIGAFFVPADLVGLVACVGGLAWFLDQSQVPA